MPKVVKNNLDGSMDIQEIKSNIQEKNIHLVDTKALCLEMTHNVCNGDHPNIEFIKNC